MLPYDVVCLALIEALDGEVGISHRTIHYRGDTYHDEPLLDIHYQNCGERST